MNSEANEIQQRMSDIRAEMNEDVVVLVESARSLLDWKGYVVAHPLLTLGAASAAGYLLVPKRKFKAAEKPDIERLMDGKRVVVAHPEQVQPKKSFLGGAVTALAGIALRTAVAKTTQHFQDSFSANMSRQANDPRAANETLTQSRS